MLQNHINCFVFDVSNFKFYLNLLIDISSNYFLNTSLDFSKRSQFLDFIAKCTKKATNPLNFFKTGFPGIKSLLFWKYLDVLISWFETLSKDDDTNSYTWNTITQL